MQTRFFTLLSSRRPCPVVTTVDNDIADIDTVGLDRKTQHKLFAALGHVAGIGFIADSERHRQATDLDRTRMPAEPAAPQLHMFGKLLLKNQTPVHDWSHRYNTTITQRQELSGQAPETRSAHYGGSNTRSVLIAVSLV